jgi:hypothetical protein
MREAPQQVVEVSSRSYRHVAHETEMWRAVCITPDFCRVGNSVIPFNSFALIGEESRSSPNVNALGTPVYRVGDLHHGVLADAGSHVVAGTSLGSGYVKFLTGQENVRANGLAMVRHGSLCRVNCNSAGEGGALGMVRAMETEASLQASEIEGGALGEIGIAGYDAEGNPVYELAPIEVTATPLNAPVNENLAALLAERADTRGILEKAGNWVSGAWEGTKRLAGAVKADPGEAAWGVAKGVGNMFSSDLVNLGVFATKKGTPVGQLMEAYADNLNRQALSAYDAGDAAQANRLASQAAEIKDSGYVPDLFALKNDAQKGGAILSVLAPVGTAVKVLGGAAKMTKGVKGAEAVADAAKVEAEAKVAAEGEAAAKGVYVAEKIDKVLLDVINKFKLPKNIVKQPADLWKIDPTIRGKAIEEYLTMTDYKDWFRVGELYKGTFPLVDFQKDLSLISLKTVDTAGKSWFGDMMRHIKDLGTRGATVGGVPANMFLDIRVQPGGLSAARVAELQAQGVKYGTNVIVGEFK